MIRERAEVKNVGRHDDGNKSETSKLNEGYKKSKIMIE